MGDNIFHKPFIPRVFFVVSLVLVFVWFKTTTATSLSHQASNYKCIDKERHALLHFKSYIHYDPYDPEEFLSTWTREEEEATGNCCEWYGVTCNNETGHVTALDLADGYLEGKISPSLLNLSYLNYLDLRGNYFSDTIPMFIGSMTQLRYLDLGWNAFTGTIPRELGNLTHLQVLSLKDLRECTIENLDWLFHLSQLEDLDMSSISLGKVDNWVNVILSLKKLSTLSLNGCRLSHVIHPYSYPSVSSPSSIVRLYLGNNSLNSSMYHWLYPLTSNKLVVLDLSGNKLDGIPKYFGNLCSLTSLYFYFNLMPIKLPDFLKSLSGCTSFTLQVLYASSSQFTGSLSNDIQKFSSLAYLSLSDNQLNGSISEKVWQLPALQRLDVSSNYLKGAISEYIGNSKILAIDLSNNPLEGIRSKAYMSNLSNVEEIELSSCKLGPRFPKWIQTLKKLSSINIANTRIQTQFRRSFGTYSLSNFDSESSTLDLSSNNFYGPIKNVSSALQKLDLSRNKFNGDISFLCQIVDGSLFFLDLSHNSFTGQIPDCLWHFKKLKLLSLGYNNLSGRLPASFKYLIDLEVLSLYKNSLYGEFPLSLKSCTKLTFLELGANNFVGYVPLWIGEKLSRLYALSPTSNNFFGIIPSQLCRLANLQILDMSLNNLYGSIPSCLDNLTSMVQN
ncbi:putative leucine-rich repeat-containing, plant-type, leucine-rich repeat domain superfamily [Helianthus annuus]|nr:putative leucine-rich repeat-containing, plant-type, leucine-rich repeat domain superfamily [Helianthus annuus]KAJ0617060.1 putative leucine-rich repeat-containing, plant-type, leucine-rich repeat domain superfamily [Helianthus annuus]KAJ0778571.1 putative leucine-rich repeat-containing, plant-type, leucine-rich repeat domain superfamily [Helianthus annuus]KAJ0941538.1 putative leucine-rich repeat-containing, plant-type, leucine-rich repeat domain superfamily [Helianthus annuus]KAJ0953229.1 